MSTSITSGKNCIGSSGEVTKDQLVEIVVQLQDEHEELRSDHDQLQDEHEELRSDHDQLQDEHEELRSDHDQLQDEHEELRSDHDQLQDDLAETRRQMAEDRQRLSTVEEELEQRDAGSSDDNPEGKVDERTPLEQVCALPEHEVENNLTANQRRARSVARRIREYGKQVPAGTAITSSRIKRVLTAQEDTTIHRQTVKRVADFLEQFGDNSVEIKETRGGKTTVVFDEEIVDRVTTVVTDQEASSVTATAI